MLLLKGSGVVQTVYRCISKAITADGLVMLLLKGSGVLPHRV